MTAFPNPLETLGIIGSAQVRVTDSLSHHEIYCWDGLLTVLWHGPVDARDVVLACGGALGGVLGPGDGAYHDVGVELAAVGIATLRVGYRAPNDLDHCVHDLLAAAALATDRGAERFVVMGHSFGGAVAVQAGVHLGERTAGVVTLATQSAGCEEGEALAMAGVPVLLLHGANDSILPFFSSQMVQMLTGGELDILDTDHAFSGVGEELRNRLRTWIPDRFA